MKPANDKYLGLVAGLEILFPICRSEMLASGRDPAQLRTLLDRHTSRSRISEEFPAAAFRCGVGTAGVAGRLFLELLERIEQPPGITDVVIDIEAMARERAGPMVDQLAESHGDWPSTEQQLRTFGADVSEKPWTTTTIRTHGALVGRALEERLFIIQLDQAGPAARLGVELDAATRLLPWYERFDVRERRGRTKLIRDALLTGWETLRGEEGTRQGADLDVALQRVFVQTDRYPPGDWVAWLASRAVDAVYSAVGRALGKAPWPPAVVDARNAATDIAMIARRLDPWTLEGIYRTLVDEPVLTEVGLQLQARATALEDPLLLRPANS